MNVLSSFVFSVPHAIGKVPFVHVGNQVVSELGPIVQFTKAKVTNRKDLNLMIMSIFKF
jgi:hypothetical protein